MSKKRPIKLPDPRAVPVGVGIDVPHVELRRACRYFWDQLLRAERDAQEEAEQIRVKFGIDVDDRNPWAGELFAATIHIFAAMTVDAVMNVFAVVRYGEPAFEEYFRRPSAEVRLKRLLHHVPGVDLSDTSELILIVKRLFRVRNYLAHAPSAETHYDAASRPLEQRDYPVVSKASAAAAIQDVDRFVELMMSFDPEVAGFVMTV